MKHLFDCVICEREICDYDFRNGRERHVAPVCLMCERHYSDRGPQAGSFMDRRLACQVSALSNMLLSKANCLDWERRYGFA